ncbi:hypothetical protein TNCV_3623601 [Trichonephila clavipes]|nr:hypothetical protein TNCV_3623601 [Trichonephila clavipes]
MCITTLPTVGLQWYQNSYPLHEREGERELYLRRSIKLHENSIHFGSRNFEFWPSDEDDTRASTLFPNFLTTPMGGCLSLDRFNVQRPPLPGWYSVVLSSNSSPESVTLTTRFLWPLCRAQVRE